MSFEFLLAQKNYKIAQVIFHQFFSNYYASKASKEILNDNDGFQFHHSIEIEMSQSFSSILQGNHQFSKKAIKDKIYS